MLDYLSVPITSGPLAVMLVSFCSAYVFVRSQDTLRPLLGDRNDHIAVQASHVGETMRLGGVAIIAALLFGFLVWDGLLDRQIVLVVATAMPALIAGLSEDLGRPVSPRVRLLAAAASACIAVVSLGVWVDRADLPGLDMLMGFAPLAIVVTIFVSAGFSHAVNLVDGMNGLVGVTMMSAAIGLSIVAHSFGQPEIMQFTLLLAAAVSGFFMLNWPLGRIFMGDAGSYGIGHILIWTSFLLLSRAEQATVPALLLILFWPFVDTLHTIARRVLSGQPVTQPDRMHLHQKVRRLMEIMWLGRNARRLSNPLTTLVLAPLIILPVVLGVIFRADTLASWIALFSFIVLFSLAHWLVLFLVSSKRFALHGNSSRSQPALETREWANVTDLNQCEYSALSGVYEADDAKATVQIYRFVGKKWRLRYWTDDGERVLARKSFESDNEAWRHFSQVSGISNPAVWARQANGDPT